MTLRYPTSGLSVNLSCGSSDTLSVNWSDIPRSVVSFYRWLYRWHSQTGDVSPSTGYLAMKQGRSERTVYRWLSRLERIGLLVRDVVQGVERRLLPRLEPPPLPRKQRTTRHHAARYRPVSDSVMSGVCHPEMSGVPITHARTQSATTTHTAPVSAPVPDVPEVEAVAPIGAIVSQVAAVGIAPAVAAQLVQTHGVDAVLDQLEALPFRKAVDRAAVLVASVRGRWSLPGKVREVRKQEVQAQEARAAKMARRAAQEARRAAQEARAAKMAALSVSDRSALLQQARAALQVEQPAAYRLMAGKAGFDAWVNARALDLLGQCQG